MALGTAMATEAQTGVSHQAIAEVIRADYEAMRIGAQAVVPSAAARAAIAGHHVPVLPGGIVRPTVAAEVWHALATDPAALSQAFRQLLVLLGRARDELGKELAASSGIIKGVAPFGRSDVSLEHIRAAEAALGSIQFLTLFYASPACLVAGDAGRLEAELARWREALARGLGTAGVPARTTDDGLLSATSTTAATPSADAMASATDTTPAAAATSTSNGSAGPGDEASSHQLLPSETLAYACLERRVLAGDDLIKLAVIQAALTHAGNAIVLSPHSRIDGRRRLHASASQPWPWVTTLAEARLGLRSEVIWDTAIALLLQAPSFRDRYPALAAVLVQSVLLMLADVLRAAPVPDPGFLLEALPPVIGIAASWPEPVASRAAGLAALMETDVVCPGRAHRRELLNELPALLLHDERGGSANQARASAWGTVSDPSDEATTVGLHDAALRAFTQAMRTTLLVAPAWDPTATAIVASVTAAASLATHPEWADAMTGANSTAAADMASTIPRTGEGSVAIGSSDAGAPSSRASAVATAAAAAAAAAVAVAAAESVAASAGATRRPSVGVAVSVASGAAAATAVPGLGPDALEDLQTSLPPSRMSSRQLGGGSNTSFATSSSGMGIAANSSEELLGRMRPLPLAAPLALDRALPDTRRRIILAAICCDLDVDVPRIWSSLCRSDHLHLAQWCGRAMAIADCAIELPAGPRLGLAGPMGTGGRRWRRWIAGSPPAFDTSDGVEPFTHDSDDDADEEDDNDDPDALVPGVGASLVGHTAGLDPSPIARALAAHIRRVPGLLQVLAAVLVCNEAPDVDMVDSVTDADATDDEEQDDIARDILDANAAPAAWLWPPLPGGVPLAPPFGAASTAQDALQPLDDGLAAPVFTSVALRKLRACVRSEAVWYRRAVPPNSEPAPSTRVDGDLRPESGSGDGMGPLYVAGQGGSLPHPAFRCVLTSSVGADGGPLAEAWDLTTAIGIRTPAHAALPLPPLAERAAEAMGIIATSSTEISAASSPIRIPRGARALVCELLRQQALLAEGDRSHWRNVFVHACGICDEPDLDSALALTQAVMPGPARRTTSLSIDGGKQPASRDEPADDDNDDDADEEGEAEAADRELANRGTITHTAASATLPLRVVVVGGDAAIAAAIQALAATHGVSSSAPAPRTVIRSSLDELDSVAAAGLGRSRDGPATIRPDEPASWMPPQRPRLYVVPTPPSLPPRLPSGPITTSPFDGDSEVDGALAMHQVLPSDGAPATASSSAAAIAPARRGRSIVWAPYAPALEIARLCRQPSSLAAWLAAADPWYRRQVFALFHEDAVALPRVMHPMVPPAVGGVWPPDDDAFASAPLALHQHHSHGSTASGRTAPLPAPTTGPELDRLGAAALATPLLTPGSLVPHMLGDYVRSARRALPLRVFVAELWPALRNDASDAAVRRGGSLGASASSIGAIAGDVLESLEPLRVVFLGRLEVGLRANVAWRQAEIVESASVGPASATASAASSHPLQRPARVVNLEPSSVDSVTPPWSEVVGESRFRRGGGLQTVPLVAMASLPCARPEELHEDALLEPSGNDSSDDGELLSELGRRVLLLRGDVVGTVSIVAMCGADDLAEMESLRVEAERSASGNSGAVSGGIAASGTATTAAAGGVSSVASAGPGMAPLSSAAAASAPLAGHALGVGVGIAPGSSRTTGATALASTGAGSNGGLPPSGAASSGVGNVYLSPVASLAQVAQPGDAPASSWMGVTAGPRGLAAAPIRGSEAASPSTPSDSAQAVSVGSPWRFEDGSVVSPADPWVEVRTLAASVTHGRRSRWTDAPSFVKASRGEERVCRVGAVELRADDGSQLAAVAGSLGVGVGSGTSVSSASDNAWSSGSACGVRGFPVLVDGRLCPFLVRRVRVMPHPRLPVVDVMHWM